MEKSWNRKEKGTETAADVSTTMTDDLTSRWTNLRKSHIKATYERTLDMIYYI
jgi:hypothetical protein